jgi:hypothetical protein
MHLAAYAVTFKRYNDSIRSAKAIRQIIIIYPKILEKLRYYLPSLVTPKILSMAAEPDELGSSSL